jgi:hypothetical protein
MLEHVKDLEQTEEMCLCVVKKDGFLLQYVKEQTEEICMEAVKQNGDSLQFVKTQTEAICFEAVKQNLEAIQYLQEQTEICLDNIKYIEVTGKQLNSHNKKFYKFINKEKCHKGLNYSLGINIDIAEFNPTIGHLGGGIYFATNEDIFYNTHYGCYFCEITVPDDARCFVENDKIKANIINIINMTLIENIIEWSDNDFCLKVVKLCGDMLKYVKNQTEEICLEAVKKYGYALRYVKTQTNEICLEAVKNHGEMLTYVEDKTEEICLEAVKRNAWALGSIENQTEEMCLEAIKQNGFSLRHVKNKTREICLEAFKQNKKSLYVVNI